MEFTESTHDNWMNSSIKNIIRLLKSKSGTLLTAEEVSKIAHEKIKNLIKDYKIRCIIYDYKV